MNALEQRREEFLLQLRRPDDDCGVRPTSGCSCVCCDDARERLRCDAPPLRSACDCRAYVAAEQCHCAFCLALRPAELNRATERDIDADDYTYPAGMDREESTDAE